MDAKLTIGVLYSCTACGLTDVEVQVTARELGEDVVVWMEEKCIPELGADHFRRNPACCTSHLSSIKIPITGTDIVGRPAVN
jgi:hypothetical protein